MSKPGFNINEAARKLAVSTRTIRRYIKSGKIRAELIKGSFGDEYRILELPPQFDPTQTMDKDKAVDKASGHASSQSFDLIRELQEKNLALAAQLGAAAERIRSLESQMKLLAPPKESREHKEHWWQRLQRFIPRRRAN